MRESLEGHPRKKSSQKDVQIVFSEGTLEQFRRFSSDKNQKEQLKRVTTDSNAKQVYLKKTRKTTEINIGDVKKTPGFAKTC